MLDKTDLDQIRKVVREEAEEENDRTRSELRVELKLYRMQLEDRLGNIDDKLKDMSIRLRKIEKDIQLAVEFLQLSQKKINSMDI